MTTVLLCQKYYSNIVLRQTDPDKEAYIVPPHLDLYCWPSTQVLRRFRRLLTNYIIAQPINVGDRPILVSAL